MAARAIWKGRLELDGADVPVKLYSAVEDRKVHFRLLHEKDLVPVSQRMVNPRTGDAVDFSDARRAFVAENGSLVVLGPEETRRLEPEPSREIEITRFVPTAAVDPAWYDRPYYLGPDGSEGRYAALAAALAESDRVGIARWVMRKKRYRGCLVPSGGHLMLMTLHSKEEMVPAAELEPEGRDLAENELKMARQLVDAMTEPFVAEDYENRHRLRVLELVEAKQAGRVVEFPEPERRQAEPDLAAALEASLKERESA